MNTTDSTGTNNPSVAAPSRRRRVWNIIKFPLLGVLLGIVILAGGPLLRVFNGGYLFGHQVTRPPFGGKTSFTILVLGLDQPDILHPELGRRSDSILLARVDLPTRTITGISIPRDTRVHLDDADGWTKINSAYTDGGEQATIRIVREITGVSPDYYAVVDTASTKELVDSVGGVDLTVDRRMDYDDNWQNLHIHLMPGYQHLDGPHAIQYLRFRHDALGDIRRMHRQQLFLRAMAGRVVAPQNLWKLPRVIPQLRRQVHTNMEDADLLYLAKQLRTIPSSHLAFTSLEGESRKIHEIDYFLPYREKMQRSIVQAFPGTVIPEGTSLDAL